MRSIIPNMLQLSVVGYPFVNPGPVGGVGTFKNEQAGTGGLPLTRKSLTRFPLPRFLAYVRASGEFSH